MRVDKLEDCRKQADAKSLIPSSALILCGNA